MHTFEVVGLRLEGNLVITEKRQYSFIHPTKSRRLNWLLDIAVRLYITVVFTINTHWLFA